jgi:hypothetical protein
VGPSAQKPESGEPPRRLTGFGGRAFQAVDDHIHLRTEDKPPVLRTNKKFVEDARRLGNRADYKVLLDRTHYSAIRKLGEPADPMFAVVRDFIRRLSSDGQ